MVVGISKATEINIQSKSQSRHQINKEQWLSSTAMGWAEGITLRSMPTFVFPGVHTGLMSGLSRETELALCSEGTTSKLAINKRGPIPWSSSIRPWEEGLGTMLFVATWDTVRLIKKTDLLGQSQIRNLTEDFSRDTANWWTSQDPNSELHS